MSDGLPSVTHLQPIDTHILGAWLLHVRGVTRYNPPISLIFKSLILLTRRINEVCVGVYFFRGIYSGQGVKIGVLAPYLRFVYEQPLGRREWVS